MTDWAQTWGGGLGRGKGEQEQKYILVEKNFEDLHFTVNITHLFLRSQLHV